jgi:hypothetical protein
MQVKYMDIWIIMLHNYAGLRRRSTATRLLRSLVRSPPGCMDVCFVFVVCCQVEVSATS